MLESGKRPRVIIAEDYVLIQENIRKVIERDCDIVAMVEDGEAALDAVGTLSPDILLLDVSLPDISGFAVAEQISHSNPKVSVIFLTAHGDKAYVKRAFEIGAKGYILKGTIWSELPAAIRTVAEGGCHPCSLLS